MLLRYNRLYIYEGKNDIIPKVRSIFIFYILYFLYVKIYIKYYNIIYNHKCNTIYLFLHIHFDNIRLHLVHS